MQLYSHVKECATNCSSVRMHLVCKLIWRCALTCMCLLWLCPDLAWRFIIYAKILGAVLFDPISFLVILPWTLLIWCILFCKIILSLSISLLFAEMLVRGTNIQSLRYKTWYLIRNIYFVSLSWRPVWLIRELCFWVGDWENIVFALFGVAVLWSLLRILFLCI